jgi:hypothetical protein
VRRRLLNLLTALSLLLCIAALVLLFVSAFLPFEHTFMRDRPRFGEVPEGPVRYEVRSEDGVLSLQVVRWDESRTFSLPLLPGPMVKPQEFRPDSIPISRRHFVLFILTRGMGSLIYGIDLTGPLFKSGVPYWRIDVSYLFVAALAFTLPGARLVARAGRRALADHRRALAQNRCVMGLCRHAAMTSAARPAAAPSAGGLHEAPRAQPPDVKDARGVS